jgi:hypothetical protein
MKNIFINNYRNSLIQNTYPDKTKESFYVNQTEASGSDDPNSGYSFKEMAQIIGQLN